MTIRQALTQVALRHYAADAQAVLAYLPALPLVPEQVKALILNETVADMPQHDFYGDPASPYATSALGLLQRAGATAQSSAALLAGGIYLTSVMKLPKTAALTEKAALERDLPLLAQELALFPALRVVLLGGDVARRAVNLLAKRQTGKNVLPGVATYRLRHETIEWRGIRLLPAYIMTGKNLEIEKSKAEMNVQELSKLLQLISD